MRILELFWDVDDCCQQFWPAWEQQLLSDGTRQRRRTTRMAPSALLTLVILFHASQYRTFKAVYTEHVSVYLGAEFPHLVGYRRFVDLMPSLIAPLEASLRRRMGRCTGVSFVDSTPLAVCKNPRIAHQRVFAGLAQRSQTSVGWFYGFKLPGIINDPGEFFAIPLTAGNVDDRRPVDGRAAVWQTLRGSGLCLGGAR